MEMVRIMISQNILCDDFGLQEITLEVPLKHINILIKIAKENKMDFAILNTQEQ